MNIAIVGGGLAGLAAAIALRHTGQDVEVYEQTREFQPVGAGISLWPNGVKVLDRLGLGDRLAALAGRLDRMGYADRSGRTLTEFNLSPLYESVGTRAWPLARADLQDLLLEAAGPERVHLGRRCVEVASDENGARVRFDDGTSADADLVVGADGTHSALRAWVARRSYQRRYVGYVNFNTIVDADDTLAPPGLWLTWVGEGKRASVMPIGNRRVYSFFDVPVRIESAQPPKPTAARDELAQAFAGWCQPVQRLLASLPADRVNRVLIHDLPTVPRWHRGRVVLLGDSVHTMAPDLGQGGCQALEDAWVLARHLASGAPLAEALAAYQRERLPRTEEIVRRARKRARLTHADDPGATEVWYRSLDGETGEQIIAGLVESVVTGPLS